MAKLALRPWEPEESVGTLWHRLIGGVGEAPRYPEAAVALPQMSTRLGLIYRAMGGAAGTQIADAVADVTRHRRSFWRRIGQAEEKITQATFDGESLSLPSVIDCFDNQALNQSLYIWLAAFVAFDDGAIPSAGDPLQSDLRRLLWVDRATKRVIESYPGLQNTHRALCQAALKLRPSHPLPPLEATIEALVQTLLGGEAAATADAAALWQAVSSAPAEITTLNAPAGYRTFQPVPLWPVRRPLPALSQENNTRQDNAGAGAAAENRQRKKAARRKSDQANRRDSLILHRFESILSWTDFLNLNRRIEDDDEANAQKAADDANEMAITDIDQRPATKIAFDLDLAPHDVNREALSGEELFAEWDYRRSAYHPDYARILISEPELADADAPDLKLPVPKSPAMRRRLRAVRRQFEALRPRRSILSRQSDGEELDIDALVESQVDLRASGHGSSRVYRRTANLRRDLSVATLIDTSRSTESIVHERPVIEIARDSLTALGHGLAASGDDHAIFAFSSLRRDRVFVNRVKDFTEPMTPLVEARIDALRPGFYTRLGAAMRYTARCLSQTTSRRRLMLVITDGKPNDLDHYEGRYGLEDSRKAIIEARHSGLAVFGIAIDHKAKHYIPYLFGQNGFTIIATPSKLVGALPMIYRHLVM